MHGESRVAVVTGGGRGIGRGIVFSLAEMGFTVVVNYRKDHAAADATCREAEARGARRVDTLFANVADLDEGCRLPNVVIDRHGRLDLWVNNAGIAPDRRDDLLKTTPESWDKVVTTNLKGPFFVSQAVANVMIDQRAAGKVREPQIVFISSISSSFASVNRAEYCVAKAGLSMVVQLFAARLAEQGIRVYEIRPGLIDTEMTRAVHEQYSARIAEGLVPIRRWGTPDDVGRAVAAIASGAFPYSTGATLDVDGGLNLRIL